MTDEQRAMLNSEEFKELQKIALERLTRRFPRCRQDIHWHPLGWNYDDKRILKAFEGMAIDTQGSDHIMIRIIPAYKIVFFMEVTHRYNPEMGWTQS